MTTATMTEMITKPHLDERWRLTPEERNLYARIPAEADYVDDPSFQDPRAEDRYFGPGNEEIKVAIWTYFPEVPEEIPSRPEARTRLKPAEERHLFLQYNYARYRLGQLLAEQREHPTAVRAGQMISWYKRAMKARSTIVRANMALVLAMAKRTRIPNVEFGELISEGNMAMLRSVEKFDVSRGFKFSTYGCRAILKSFNRLATKTSRYHQRFPTEYDPSMERSDYDEKKHLMQQEHSLESLREILEENRAALSDVEMTILMERFAIGSEGKGRTLAEVGKMIGLTNERVRQIQNRALGKIKEVLDEEYLSSPIAK